MPQRSLFLVYSGSLEAFSVLGWPQECIEGVGRQIDLESEWRQSGVRWVKRVHCD